eukprot:TRINITY_DN14435_c0_g1_i1.p1 TRINITY_DN14435_c0_g1~~TRINITY_DN14435_c0_g1_i1.p1  ORF type:complete len:704 (-),score=137.13 TRINITY_DN14435_c0_g1_i1:1064-3175(-)
MKPAIVFCLFIVYVASATAAVLIPAHDAAASGYQLGVGIYDITGPAAEEGMMGYAMVGQRTHGIHFRLRARAYIFDDGAKRVVFVNVDACMVMEGIKLTVVQRLQDKYGPDLYTNDNVMLSGIHTHAGPGGFSWYSLYDITTFGFSKGNFDTIANGIVSAIERAHDNAAGRTVAGKVLINKGKLYNSNRNRSPFGYINNPQWEKDMYPDGNTDKDMVVIRLEDATSTELGMVSWFAVHCTSMNNTNQFISGDNKGFASYLVEREKNGNLTLPGTGPFIAAFAQSNEGDVSPNTLGAFCPDGTSCENPTSTCDGKTEGCIARGPGWPSDFLSTEMIAEKQTARSLELYEAATEQLVGPVDYRHMFLDMTAQTVSPKFTNASVGKTCRGAMGYSFAAGTTDGPGDFSFIQGDNSTSNPFWNFLAHFIAKPTPDQIACQAPKPILLDVGQTEPYPWVPDVLPVQLFRIGRLFIAAVPGEFTTMSGRRLRATIRAALVASDPSLTDAEVVIAGLANAYSGYITTHEEYVVQRYEAASTVYGPWTLAAYQQAFDTLATALVTGVPAPEGPTPRNLSGFQINFQPGVIEDSGPFGKVVTDVAASYSRGQTAQVVFFSAHPKNNYMIEQSYLTVEQLVAGQWTVRFTDGSIETRYQWQRVGLAESHATISWTIPEWTPVGQYRIRTFGTSKDLFGVLTNFQGSSSTFTVN